VNLLTIAVHVVLYGLLAAASALAITSVVAVLRTSRGRVNGTAFAIGFVSAQLAVTVLALGIGLQSVPKHGQSHQLFESTLRVLVGIGLLVAAWQVRHPHPHPPRRRQSRFAARGDAALTRLRSLHPGAMLGAGGLLGIGGPKRLTLAILAAATIAAGSLSTTTEYSFVAVYVTIATMLVWVPVMLTLVFGGQAAEWTAAAQAWWRTHRSTAIFVPLVVLGGYFLGVGIAGFATN
jgi:hypothetical protein